MIKCLRLFAIEFWEIKTVAPPCMSDDEGILEIAFEKDGEANRIDRQNVSLN